MRIWDIVYDSGLGSDIAPSIAIDSNNNFYVVGYKSNGTDYDWWLKKLFSDGERIIKSNALLQCNYYFLGLAIDAGVKGDTGKQIQISGTVSEFSGLLPGFFYYLSDTPRQLSTSGSYSNIAGIALSTTELKIEK